MFLSEELLQEIHERAPRYDKENAWPAEDYAALKEAGYLKAFVPKEYGGFGLSLKEIAQEQRLKHHVLDMSLLGQITENALTSDIEIEAEEGEVPNTFVDGRNHLFLSFAAVLAKQRGITDIVTGVCETDFSGYPDCRDVFVKSLNVTLNLAMAYDFVIQTPLMWLDKAETWALADQLGAFDYVREKTLTCYNGIIGTGCGECPACHLRQKGLEKYLAERGEA